LGGVSQFMPATLENFKIKKAGFALFAKNLAFFAAKKRF